jgi:hypothetical protein
MHVTISTTSGEFMRKIWYRLWYPQNVVISTSDDRLNIVENAEKGTPFMTGSSCSDIMYQTAKLYASAEFVVSGSDKIFNKIDITKYVTFVTKSGGNGILQVKNSRYVQGKSEGEDTILLSMCSICSTNSHSSKVMKVTSTPVHVKSLRSSVITGIDILGNFPSNTFTDNQIADVVANVYQKLDKEKATGNTFYQAVFSDGTTNIIKEDVDLVSNIPASLTVVNSAQGTVKVPIGAVGISGNETLTGTWSTCGDQIAQTHPYVNITIPSLVKLELTVSQTHIYHEDDAYAKSPISVTKKHMTSC